MARISTVASKATAVNAKAISAAQNSKHAFDVATPTHNAVAIDRSGCGVQDNDRIGLKRNAWSNSTLTRQNLRTMKADTGRTGRKHRKQPSHTYVYTRSAAR